MRTMYVNDWDLPDDPELREEMLQAHSKRAAMAGCIEVRVIVPFLSHRPLCEWGSNSDCPSLHLPEDLEPGELCSIFAPDLSNYELHDSNWSALSEPLC